MKTKYVGIILIVLSLFFLVSTFTIHNEMEDIYMEQMLSFEGGSCVLANGTCIHKNPLTFLFVILYIAQSALFLFGIFLIMVNKSYENLAQKLYDTTTQISEIKKRDSEDNEFRAFLKGFSDDEKKVLIEIKKKDGIWQSTLRIKTNLSKATLSIILSKLEKEGHIVKVKKGKTNEIWLTGK